MPFMLAGCVLAGALFRQHRAMQPRVIDVPMGCCTRI
jgi:hypothetical protein